MQYLGGKFRISKPLSEFLNQQMTEDDTFCGFVLRIFEYLGQRQIEKYHHQ
jgi:hypothetical protein